jgi:Ca2+-binding RTX toxin-like protein
MDLGAGFDTDDVTAPSDTSFSTLYALAGVEKLIAATFGNEIHLVGNNLDNLLMVQSDLLLPLGETLDGNAGNDTLIGSRSDSVLNGGPGNDLLVGNAGSDTMHGGDGNDTLDGENGIEFANGFALSSDELFGDAGIDTADYSHRRLGLKLSLDNIANDGSAGEGDNIHADIENILGGNGVDSIVGNPFNNSLVGNGGNDTIFGGDGNDTLVGGPGNDQLYGQGGNDRLLALDGQKDTLDGGAGVDVAQRDNSATVKDVVLNVESFI